MTQPKKPTDLGQDFIDSGMRLITQQSSDHLLSDLNEVDYWCKEFPTLPKEDIQAVLDAIDSDN